MKCYIISAVLMFLVVSVTFGAKLPAFFKRCHVSPELDNMPNECLKGSADEAIRSLAGTGNKELGAVDLDPMRINRINIEQGEASPIAIKLDYTDNNFYGLGDFTVNSVEGKLSSPKDFMLVLNGQVDQLKLIGPYKISGKVLILPIQGDGKSIMIMDNVTTTLTIKADSQMKNGKEYLKIRSLTMSIDIKRLHTQMNNLFNGDKALGDNMNKFLNDNWQDIYNELRPAIEASFGAIFQEYTRRIMERIPFKDIFLVD